jgi:hypothetical protein
MSCNCHSYNKRTGETPEVVLDPNDYFDWDAPARKVCIDACIAELVKELWRNRVWTGGSCCGHGSVPLSVIIESVKDGDKALEIMKRDGRDFELLCWKLCDLRDER